MRPVDVAIMGYSVDLKSSWEQMQVWESELNKYHGDQSNLLKILVGAKCDLPKTWDQSEYFMMRYCREHGYLRWWEVSAKDNINVSEVFHYIAALLLQPTPEEEKEKEKKKEINFSGENKDARCNIA